MDRNGYNASLFKTEPGKCYVCMRFRNTARHEVFYGISNRKLAKKHGLWINVCPNCHRSIHAHDASINGVDLDYRLKAMGQRLWLEDTGKTKYDFRQIFGKTYEV